MYLPKNAMSDWVAAAERGTFASSLTLWLLMVGPVAPGPPWSPS
jgi:hypothetical protein